MKYKVYMGKSVVHANPALKLTPRQAKFAKWQIGMTKSFVKVK